MRRRPFHRSKKPVVSARLMYLVHTRRLLFIAERSFYDWTLNRMQPWVHYVPVARDLSDVQEKIEWADGHVEEVERMIGAMTAIAPMRADALDAVRAKLYQKPVFTPRTEAGLSTPHIQSEPWRLSPEVPL